MYTHRIHHIYNTHTYQIYYSISILWLMSMYIINLPTQIIPYRSNWFHFIMIHICYPLWQRINFLPGPIISTKIRHSPRYVLIWYIRRWYFLWKNHLWYDECHRLHMHFLTWLTITTSLYDVRLILRCLIISVFLCYIIVCIEHLEQLETPPTRLLAVSWCGSLIYINLCIYIAYPMNICNTAWHATHIYYSIIVCIVSRI